MAKELPYFKFEPAEWDNGNIQMCTRESKGLFIDLCSVYWSRVGELPYALALQKHCNGNKDALQELVDHQIIGIVEDQIVIEFLDEQLLERGQTSEKRREAAQKRWADASALQMESKSNAKRKEENREEEKKREEKSDPLPRVLPFTSVEFANVWSEWENYRKELKRKLPDSTAKKQLQFLGARPEKISIAIINQSIQNGWTGLFELKNTTNGNGVTRKQQADQALRASVADYYSEKSRK